MAIPTILLVSEFENVQMDLLSCFSSESFNAEIISIRDWRELEANLCQKIIHVIIADDASVILPVRQVLAASLKNNPSCLVYALFDALQPERISDLLHAGATSFALKSQLAELLPAVQTRLAAAGTLEGIDHAARQAYFLKVFFEQSADSIWAKDKNGKYLLINPAGATFLSKPVEDIIGKSDYEVFPKATADKIAQTDRQVIETGVTRTIEDLIINRDGAKKTFQAVKTVLRSDDGQVQGIIGTVRDITERKQAEEALRESEQRFRLLIENVKDYAIYMLDPAGYVTTWNISAERLSGYQAQEIIGKHFSCFFGAESQSQGFPSEVLEKTLEHGHFEQEGWWIRKDGSLYWVNVITTALFDDESQLIGFSNIVRDMSERKESEEALKYYAHKLEQSNQDLEQFAFIASHDLQAPLRKVKIFSEILQKSAGEANQDIAERLQASVTKMQLLITDLLSLSRVNRKGNPLEMTNLNAVVEDALDNLEVVIQEQKADVQIEELLPIMGDHAQLVQLFQNIVGNALKFQKKQVMPTIQIRGKVMSDGFYQVSVQDNGIGFDEKHLSKIFYPFERLHGDNQFAGTGMGLAICKKIIERHGGQLTATSREGHGSTFIFTLPLTVGK